MATKTKRATVATKSKKGNKGGKCAAFNLPINAALAAKLAHVAGEKKVRGGARAFAMKLIRESV